MSQAANKIRSEYKKKLNSAQVVVETKLQTENDSPISRILSITAESFVLAVEPLSGEARYNGRVNFKVMYMDGAGAVNCLDYIADYEDKILDESLDANSVIICSSAVVDTDASNLGSNQIGLSSVVEITAFMVASDEIDVCVNDNNDIYTQTETVEFSSLIGKFRQEFIVTNETEINDKVSKVLLSESKSCVTSAESRLDSIMIRGKIVSNVVYLPADGMLKNMMFTTQFEQEIAANGVKADSVIDISAEIDKWQVRLIVSEADGKSILKAEYKLCGQGFAFQPMQREVITDAFCIGNELQINAESWSAKFLRGVMNVEQAIEGSANLDDGMASIDNILSICGNLVNIANSYAESGRLVVEGVLNTSVIYYNKEFETVNSVAVEIPYSVTMAADGMEAGSLLEITPAIIDIGAKRKKPDSIDINANVNLQIKKFASVTAYAIKELVVGEARLINMNAIAIYIAKPNQTLWDVSKTLGTTPEVLLTQNPDLQSPLKGGERILIYRQLAE